MEELQREEAVTTWAWLFSVQVLCTYLLADCSRIDFPWEVVWVMKSSRSFKVAPGVLVGLKGCHSSAQYKSISWKVAHISTHIHHKVVGSCSIADAIAKDVAEDGGFYGSEVAKPQSSRTDQVALAILANKHRKCGERCCFVESDLGVAVCFQSRQKHIHHSSMLVSAHQSLLLLICRFLYSKPEREFRVQRF